MVCNPTMHASICRWIIASFTYRWLYATSGSNAFTILVSARSRSRWTMNGKYGIALPNSGVLCVTEDASTFAVSPANRKHCEQSHLCQHVPELRDTVVWRAQSRCGLRESGFVIPERYQMTWYRTAIEWTSMIWMRICESLTSALHKNYLHSKHTVDCTNGLKAWSLLAGKYRKGSVSICNWYFEIDNVDCTNGIH